MVAPNAIHPGGITRAIDTWRAAGLERWISVETIGLSAWDDPVPVQVWQAARGYVRLARRLRARRPPDVVHLHVSSGGSLYRKLIAAYIVRAFGLPYVAHLHSGGFERWLERRRAHRWASRQLFSRARLVIVLGPRWRELARRCGAQEVRILPHTIPPALVAQLGEVRARRARAASAAELPGAERVLLYYGRWAPVKGLDLLARALPAACRDSVQSVEMRLWGNGDGAWLRGAFRDVGGCKLTLNGWLSDADKPPELVRASAFVYPSREEAFGQGLLEAMCAGVPIVASDAGGIPDVLAGYPLARLVPAGRVPPLAQALRESVLHHPGVVSSPSAHLPARFRPDAVMRELVAAYDVVCARRP